MPQPRINKNTVSNPAEMERPAVSLLNDQQWQYLRRRFKITPRELEIAKLICLGLTSEEISTHLKISAGTVKVHTRNLYRKTWVENKILMLLRFIEDSSGLFVSPEAD